MKLAELLQTHPWPPEYLAKGRPLDWIEKFHIRAAREELWPVLMDTSRFNRFMGLPEMKYEERDGVMYGSTASTRPPGLSTRDASSKNRCGSRK